MNRKKLILWICVGLVILGYLGVHIWLVKAQSSADKKLAAYGETFGFSLGEAKAELVDAAEFPAFQDPLHAYVIKVTGETKETIFDLALMSEGVSWGANQAVTWLQTEQKNANEKPLFEITEDGAYRSRTLTDKWLCKTICDLR